MSVKTILMIGNPLLKNKSENVDFEKDPVVKYIGDLKDTLHKVQKEKKLGRAIAGPQIGYFKRIIYMETKGKSIVMINPVIIQKSAGTFEVWDSCFSADLAFFGKTIRYKEISIEYTTENQKRIQEIFSDDLSELFQHEIDHLDGILFTDHIVDNQVIMRSEWEKLKKTLS